MHIPDGFIPISQCLIYYVILIVALYFSVKWARSNLDEKRIPLLAVLAAGIFAIMSMNMPIPFGTSGHMVGGALVAIVFMAPEAIYCCITHPSINICRWRNYCIRGKCIEYGNRWRICRTIHL